MITLISQETIHPSFADCFPDIQDLSDKEAIEKRIVALQNELTQLFGRILNIDRLKEQTVLPTDSLVNFRRSFPWATIEVDAYTITLTASRMPFNFHTDRSTTENNRVNNGVVYVTLPLYDYEMAFYPDGSVSGEAKKGTLHHPHSNSHDETFGNNCYGNNTFVADYKNFRRENSCNAAELLSILTRACIWLSSANLSDMFDPGRLMRTVSHEDVDITNACPHLRYALWCKEHFNMSCMPFAGRTCLRSAIDADIDALVMGSRLPDWYESQAKQCLEALWNYRAHSGHGPAEYLEKPILD